MEKLNQKKKHHAKNLNLNTPEMQVELGSEWTGDAKRAAEKVETRVKTSAARYGFFEDLE